MRSTVDPARSGHPPRLTIVEGSSATGGRPLPASNEGATQDVDWAILMARAQDGDRSAYQRLLHEISPYIRSLVVRYHRDRRDVEDTVQDILLTIHAVRRTYDPGRPFAPWLVAITNRRVIDRLRRQGRTRDAEVELTEEHETFAATPSNFQETSVDARALRQAVERLPAGQRQAVTLLKLQELSLKEASAMTGTSVAALKVATHRALKTLRRMLHADNES